MHRSSRATLTEGCIMLFLAQAGISWSVANIAIAIVIIAALVALVLVALRQFGIAIPAWVQQIFWILIVAFVVIFAIKLLMRM